MQHFDKLKPTPKSKSTSAMSNEPIVSHGRGGAGNIEPDSKTYTDGEIVREGPVGDQGDGAYSTGVRSIQPTPYNIIAPPKYNLHPQQKLKYVYSEAAQATSTPQA